MPAIERLVLIGLSGTGKSTVATLVADRLGWAALDSDAEIERETGVSIPEFFQSEGEVAFRAIERRVLTLQLARQGVVIATGGGAVVADEVWDASLLGDAATFVVWLDAEPEVLIARLAAQAAAFGDAAARPLLEGDALARLVAMRDARVDAYRQADLVLGVGNRFPDAIADICADLVWMGNRQATTIDLAAAGGESRIQIGRGTIEQLGEVVAERWPGSQRVFLAIDEGVRPHADGVVERLEDLGSRDINVTEIPSGEGSKSLEGLSRLYDWMLNAGIERGDVVVALGGGVAGDLVGFAAATVLRGVGLVQIPTTLLSMVDSSVGGKTGINHEAGKNLIGSFYQPDQVLIDPDLLASLPVRERRSGWAEIIKHAVIERSTPRRTAGLLDILERNSGPLQRGDSPHLEWMISRNVALKAGVVERDEREAGIRAYLNFGHTIGHAVEAAGYRLLHGEAIAVGMCAALHIARELDRIDPDHEQRIRTLIAAYGLPTSANVDEQAVWRFLQHDKKRRAGVLHWVLPEREGGVELVSNVPDDVVRRAIGSIVEHA